MPGMEENAGYEDFFGPREWHAIVTGDWSVLDSYDEDFEDDWGWSS